MKLRKFLFKCSTRSTNYPNLFCYKTVHVSGILSAHHQEFCTVHSALVSFMQVFSMTASKQSQDGTVAPSWLYLEKVVKKPAWNLPVLNVQ